MLRRRANRDACVFVLETEVERNMQLTVTHSHPLPTTPLHTTTRLTFLVSRTAKSKGEDGKGREWLVFHPTVSRKRAVCRAADETSCWLSKNCQTFPGKIVLIRAWKKDFGIELVMFNVCCVRGSSHMRPATPDYPPPTCSHTKPKEGKTKPTKALHHQHQHRPP